MHHHSSLGNGLFWMAILRPPSLLLLFDNDTRTTYKQHILILYADVTWSLTDFKYLEVKPSSVACPCFNWCLQMKTLVWPERFTHTHTHTSCLIIKYAAKRSCLASLHSYTQGRPQMVCSVQAISLCWYLLPHIEVRKLHAYFVMSILNRLILLL